MFFLSYVQDNNNTVADQYLRQKKLEIAITCVKIHLQVLQKFSTKVMSSQTELDLVTEDEFYEELQKKYENLWEINSNWNLLHHYYYF